MPHKKTRPTALLRKLATSLMLACVTLPGCVLSQTTDGTPITKDRVSEIVVGHSTRADVANALGAPDEIIYSNLEHDPLFERAYRYLRTKRKTTYFTIILFSASRSDSNQDNVIVFFDDRGVVEDIATRLDMDAPRYGTPWSGDDK